MDGRGEGLPGGMEVGRMLGTGVAVDGAGVTGAGLGAADVGRVPGGAPGDGAPPHAARPAIAALAAASRASSTILMPSASVAHGGRKVIRKSVYSRQRSPVTGLTATGNLTNDSRGRAAGHPGARPMLIAGSRGNG